MKATFFSIHEFEKKYLEAANNGSHELNYVEESLSDKTLEYANNSEAVSLFVSDDASAGILEKLKKQGVNYIALRSAGFNHVDLKKAEELKFKVNNVPHYSPNAVAEHAVLLMLALNRKLIKANKRIMQHNFLLDGLTGFDMHGKTAGIIGTGNIGKTVIKILQGFGCKIMAFDLAPDKSLSESGVIYTSIDKLLQESDIISLHVPLTGGTRYMIDESTIAKMKTGVMLINTARGALIDTGAVIDALKTEKIGYFGMDVYENEKDLFFKDHSESILTDDLFVRLMGFQNVIITGHQAFLTDTALTNIAKTTIQNLDCFAKNEISGNELISQKIENAV